MVKAIIAGYFLNLLSLSCDWRAYFNFPLNCVYLPLFKLNLVSKCNSKISSCDTVQSHEKDGEQSLLLKRCLFFSVSKAVIQPYDLAYFSCFTIEREVRWGKL